MKKLFLLFLLAPSFAVAQVPAVEWQKSMGGSIGETAQSVIQTADGNLVIAGYSWSNDGDVSGNHGLSDIWVVKMTLDGNLLWQKCYGGSNNDVAYSIEQMPDGGFILAGYSRSSDGDITSNKGLTDYCILRLDAIGNLLWEKSYGGSDDDWAFAVHQTTDGGFVVAGESKSGDGDATVNHGDWDYWILKLNSSGELIWQRSLGGSEQDECYSVCESADGNIIAAGGAHSLDGDVAGNHGGADGWIVKLNTADGDLLWQQCLGGSRDEYLYAIDELPDGNLAVAGATASSDGDFSVNKGLSDVAVMLLDADAHVLWARSYGGSNYDGAMALEPTADGGFIVAGNSQSGDGDVAGNYGSNDCWVLRLDGTGSLLWQNHWGGSAMDQANAIMQTIAGDYVMAGLSFSDDHDVSGNHPGFQGNSEDYWIVKLSGEETGITTALTVPLAITPNPAHDFLQVQLPSSGSEQMVVVYDACGRIIPVPMIMQHGKALVNTGGLSSGCYLLRINDPETGVSRQGKFIKY